MKTIKVLISLVVLSSASCILYAESRKDLVNFGGSVAVKEDMTVQNAVSVGGDVKVDGMVGKNAVAIGGSVTLGPKAVVKKNVVAVNGKIIKTEGSRIGGNTVEVNPGNMCPVMAGLGVGIFGMFWLFKLLSLLGFIVFAALLISIIPRFTDKITAEINSSPAQTSLWGIVGLIAIVPVGGLLLISIAGIPLIPVEIIAVILSMVMGYIAVSAVAGKKILAALKFQNNSVIINTITGLMVLEIVRFVPVIGLIVKAAAVVMGFGAIIVAIQKSIKK